MTDDRLSNEELGRISERVQAIAASETNDSGTYTHADVNELVERDAPRLLAEIERLGKRNAALQDMLQRITDRFEEVEAGEWGPSHISDEIHEARALLDT